MRKLTDSEERCRAERAGRLMKFVEECMPLLSDFAQRLGAPEPYLIVANPDDYIDIVNDFVRCLEVLPEDRVWIITRLGYYIGETLIQRLSGGWFLNEWPDTRYFLRYVAGRFHGEELNIMVDPFEAAESLIDSPPPRELSQLISEIEFSCKSNKGNH